jgi:hypothetical protein
MHVSAGIFAARFTCAPCDLRVFACLRSMAFVPEVPENLARVFEYLDDNLETPRDAIKLCGLLKTLVWGSTRREVFQHKCARLVVCVSPPSRELDKGYQPWVVLACLSGKHSYVLVTNMDGAAPLLMLVCR